MEQLLDILVWFFISYLLARMLTGLLLSYLTRELRREVEDIVDRLDSGKLIPVTVEVDQNQYFCYNSITKAFVCQGYNIKEIADRFNLRFPESKLAIHNGDETAVKVLKEQMEKLYEDRNRK